MFKQVVSLVQYNYFSTEKIKDLWLSLKVRRKKYSQPECFDSVIPTQFMQVFVPVIFVL